MAKAKNQAVLEEEAKKFDRLTDDGKEHKQGEKIQVEAFDVIIETNF